MKKILVIGDDLRSFLAIVRSLGRAGYHVHAAPFDFSSPALASRYITATHRLPRYAGAPQAWLTTLQALIAEHQYALIIPCGDNHLLPLAHHQEELAGAIALPSEPAFDVFFDKVKTRALAVQCGVPVAHGGPISDALIGELGLPFALKPCRSVRLMTIGTRGEVQIIRTRDEIAAALNGAVPRDEYFVEAFFAGEGVGVSVLAEHGRVLMAFQHRRLAETSEAGGSSSRVSEDLDPALMTAVSAMCAAVAYHGVAMFEFRRNPATRAFVLLEVNARFWGSLPLAVACGVNFPAHLVALLLSNATSTQPRYPSGVIRRHLTAEYYRILHQSESATSPSRRLLELAWNLARLVVDVLAKPAQFDSFAPDDTGPLHAERKRLTRNIIKSVTHRLPASHSALVSASRKTLQRLLDAPCDTPRFIFICLGNICRSPFAERAFVARLNTAADVTSAGTLMLHGRSPPADAISSARAFGISLDDHRSRTIDLHAIDTATAVFIFDDRNADDLAQLGVAPEKVIHLGHVIGLRTIDDPYGRGSAIFESCYAQITRAVDVIAAAIHAR